MILDFTSKYIRNSFRPDDRLSVVLINHRTNSTIRRFSSAEAVAGSDYQNWLRTMNQFRYDVSISMNAMHSHAGKEIVADIRHIYLDFDRDGDSKIDSLIQRRDIPRPRFITKVSPDKWNAVWNVNAFDKGEAAQLQKGLAIRTGASPRSTDLSSVLPLPYFFNHEHGRAYLVQTEAHALAGLAYRPEDFPKALRDDRDWEVYEVSRDDFGARLLDSLQSFAKRVENDGELPTTLRTLQEPMNSGTSGVKLSRKSPVLNKPGSAVRALNAE